MAYAEKSIALDCLFITATLVAVFVLNGCGKNAASSPDFALSVSPSSVSADVGKATMPVTISISGQAGFTGSVSISLQGVPEGIAPSPGSSFSLMAGESQEITFSIADSAAVGPTSITVIATGGSHSHTAQFSLTANALVRTYQVGSVLYLEAGTSTDTSRIGLETDWGGSIVEVSLNGTEFVNHHDTGREVQPDFYDGDDTYCCGAWGWNPNLGGDILNQGTPIISYSVDADSLYTKAQSLQWSPVDFGGGQGTPIPGDLLVEQTITAVTSQPHTFKTHYKVTHLGTDLHTNNTAELPAVFTNQVYKKLIYYAGTSPWTSDSITSLQLPAFVYTPVLYIPEHWGALVDDQNVGLTVYLPSQYPYGVASAVPTSDPGGPTDYSTNYYSPGCNLTVGPGFVVEGDFYVIAGDYREAREIIYRLHQSLSAPDILPPLGATDQPAPGATLSGTIPVTGWAFDDVNVARVEILMDGTADGTASYGSARPDVAGTFPHAPLTVGFSYSLDTSRYANGPHKINVRAADTSGNVAVLPSIAITVSNGMPGATPVQGVPIAPNSFGGRTFDSMRPFGVRRGSSTMKDESN